MKLEDYIKKQRIRLEERINTFLTQKKESVPSGLNTLSDTLNTLQTIIPKGKLLRGIQVLLAHEMFNGRNQEGALDAAAALEIIQAAVLIQDDFMDNDEMRRGQRSVFAQYVDRGKRQGNQDSLLYGQSMATCVGDIGFFLAFELLSHCSSENNIASEIVALFSHEWQLVGAGQMMDVDFAGRLYEPTEDEVMNIYRYKTARYSFSLPLIMGAKLAQADLSVQKSLDLLGETLGIMFQIKDDELGIFGDEAVTGKPVGSDIRENKKTLLRSMLNNKVSKSEKNTLAAIFGNVSFTTEHLQYVKDLIISYGILKDLNTKMETEKQKVDSLINKLPITKEYADILHQFTNFIYKRSK